MNVCLQGLEKSSSFTRQRSCIMTDYHHVGIHTSQLRLLGLWPGKHKAGRESFKAQNLEQYTTEFPSLAPYNVLLKTFINFLSLSMYVSLHDPGIHGALEVLGQELWMGVSHHVCAGTWVPCKSIECSQPLCHLSSPWSSL